ncbi:DNA helicase MCM9 [Petromyzon marinus]|uniref:DNA helicase MCM9 n=1 Tax=Petromyzon marinus TaxID=7757 RepID=A0AAJ7U499_PETMA|nr:DNA helicase MCM9 [Petromyzon marinus]
MEAERLEQLGRAMEAYALEHHGADLLRVLRAPAGAARHYPVLLDAMALLESDMALGESVLALPSLLLPACDEALARAQAALLARRAGVDDGGGGGGAAALSVKPNVHARFTGLPQCPELSRERLPLASDAGRLLRVSGTVIRTGATRLLEHERTFACLACGRRFPVRAELETFHGLSAPAACPAAPACRSTRFTGVGGEGGQPGVCRDYQEVKIQEQVQKLAMGTIPRSMVVVLEDDLVDTCKSGDDVTVCGVVTQRWRPLVPGSRCDLELVLRANHLEVANDGTGLGVELGEEERRAVQEFWEGFAHNPLAGRNVILASLCPQVFGMYVVKLAVALVLAGGVARVDPSGTRVRGEPHLLLVGDPGTGKSQLLKYAAKITPRSVLTTGIGSTSAGLTVAAVRDGGDWGLEAGALVLADGGLCCIDEFSSIREHDRASVHEAMEQQSISVAKAGLVCKLSTRTTVLAATNPKGRVEAGEPLSSSVALASPLLSRFDLVLVLLDARNEDWDRIVSSFILQNRGAPPCDAEGIWPMERMRCYFRLARSLEPQLSDDANRVLAAYYRLQRASDTRSAARTTVRLLESLVRLAEAHARLMLRGVVTVEDAVTVVSVMETSMQGGALTGGAGVNALHTCFPDDPVQQYQAQCDVLLARLGLHDLLRGETERLHRLKSSQGGGGDGEEASPSAADDGAPAAGDSSASPPDGIPPTPDPRGWPLTSTPLEGLDPPAPASPAAAPAPCEREAETPRPPSSRAGGGRGGGGRAAKAGGAGGGRAGAVGDAGTSGEAPGRLARFAFLSKPRLSRSPAKGGDGRSDGDDGRDETRGHAGARASRETGQYERGEDHGHAAAGRLGPNLPGGQGHGDADRHNNADRRDEGDTRNKPRVHGHGKPAAAAADDRTAARGHRQSSGRGPGDAHESASDWDASVADLSSSSPLHHPSALSSGTIRSGEPRKLVAPPEGSPPLTGAPPSRGAKRLRGPSDDRGLGERGGPEGPGEPNAGASKRSKLLLLQRINGCGGGGGTDADAGGVNGGGGGAGGAGVNGFGCSATRGDGGAGAGNDGGDGVGGSSGGGSGGDRVGVSRKPVVRRSAEVDPSVRPRVSSSTLARLAAFSSGSR